MTHRIEGSPPTGLDVTAPVTGLRQQDFEVRVDDAPVRVHSVSAAAGPLAAVVLLGSLCIATVGCSVSAGILVPSSHFVYPNSNVEPILLDSRRVVRPVVICG